MGAKIDGGTLVVSLEVDSKGFIKQVEKEIDKTTKIKKKSIQDQQKLKDLERKKEIDYTYWWEQQLKKQEKAQATAQAKIVKEKEKSLKLQEQAELKSQQTIEKIKDKYIKSGLNKINGNLGNAYQNAKDLNNVSGIVSKVGAIATSVGFIAATAYTAYKIEDYTNKLYQRRVNYLGDVVDRTKTLKNTISNIGDSVNQTIQATISNMEKLYNTTINTAKEFNEFVTPAASFAESLNVIDRAFKENGDGIVEWASTLKTQFGIVQGDAIKIASTYGLLLSNYGFDTNITDEYSKVLTALVGDWSSLTDTSQETMAGYFSSAIFGSNTRQLRNLGIDLGAAAMQQFMLDKGIQGTYNSLSQEEKVVLKLQKAIENSNIAIGDFQMTQKSWSNQTRILTNTLKQIQTYLGQGFISVAGNAIYMINTLLNKIQQVAYTFSYVMKLIFGDSALGGANGSIGGTIAGAVEEGYDAASDALENTANNAAKTIKNALLGIDDITKLGSSDASGVDYGNGLGVPSLETGIYDKLFGEFTPDENVLIFFDEIYNTIMKIKTMIDHFKDGWRELGERLTPFKTSVSDLYKNFLKPMGEFTWESLKQFHDKFLLKIADFALTDDNGLIRLNKVLSNFGTQVNWTQLNNDFGNLCETSATIANMAFAGIISLIDRLTQKYDRNNESILSQINTFFANLLFGEDLAKGYLEAQKNNNIIESRNKNTINGISAYGTSGRIPGATISTNSRYDAQYRNVYKNSDIGNWQQKIYNKINKIAEHVADTAALIGKGGTFESVMNALGVYLATGNKASALGAYFEDAGKNSNDKYKENYGKRLRKYGEMETLTEVAFGEDNLISRFWNFMQLKQMKQMPSFVNYYADKAANANGNSAMQDTTLYNKTMELFGVVNDSSLKTQELVEMQIKTMQEAKTNGSVTNNVGSIMDELNIISNEKMAIMRDNMIINLANISASLLTFSEDWKLKFENIKTIISQKFSTLGTTLGATVSTWKVEISKGLLTLKSSIKSGFTNIINGAIEIINKGIGYINKIPGVNFGMIGTIKGYKNGGVFEPRNEKLIRVGDNRNEREVISPLSLMKQAMRETMLESGSFGGNNKEIVIHNYMTTDGQVLAQATNRYNESNNWRQYAYS